MSTSLKDLASSRVRRPTLLAREDGNVAMLFGLALIPLMGAVGLAVDYGRLMVAQSTARMAADSAALYASGYAKELILKSDGSDAKVAAALTESRQRAEAMFRAQVARIDVREAPTVTIEPTREGQNINVEVRYSLNVSTTLGQIFRVDSLSSSGRAAAGASLPVYTDLYLALDVSQSMGLAATPAAAKTLFNAVKAIEGNKGCVFGCHVPSNSKTWKSYQQIAVENNVAMRVDVLRDSVTKIINTAEADSGGSSAFRIGLYTMSLASPGSPSNGYALTELSPLSANYASLRNAAKGIDLGPNNSGGTGDSYLNEQLRDLAGKMHNSGDGTSQSKAKTYVMIITDGVRDIPGACESGHCMGTIDSKACKALKDKGATVGVIYTTYLPIVEDPNVPNSDLHYDYKGLVEPIADKIAPALQQCASSTGSPWFAEASDGPTIDAALQAMFRQTTKQARLTN